MSITNPTTVFEQWAHRYVEHMQALGRRFETDRWILGRLCRFLGQNDAEDLDRALFERWCATHHALHANVRRSHQRVVRKLCLYRQRTEPESFVPDASRFPRRQPYRAAVIFGPPEVARLLRAADELRHNSSVPLRQAALRLAVVLFYTAGLRLGELIRLKLGDIDVADGTAIIRDTKFCKSRLVPLSVDAQRELRSYLKQRLAPPWDASPEAPLIGHQQHSPFFRRYHAASMGRCIRELYSAADVRGADGRLARVHDFRHSFAVQALLRWYRTGADVQSCLPKLSMYMGHVSIVSTAYYLQWIPEIADVASSQFERHFGHLIPGEPS
ncbi:MAG: tyrosine-type recombinase/integrase [Gammaproteobacteria bacterium]